MSYRFVNPYNYISLNQEKGCRKIKVDENEEKLTGYIDCELETLTPLIMIDSMSKSENNGHVTFDKIFMLNNVPAIPASELRGCIRAKFETLTNSCLSNYEEDDVFYGRFKEGAIKKAGLLDFTNPDNVRLYKAKRYVVDENKSKYNLRNLKSGDVVYFNVDNTSESPIAIITNKKEKDEFTFEGIYKVGEEFGDKTHKHVFAKNKDEDITDELKNGNKLKSLYEKCCDLSYTNLKRRDHNSEAKGNLRPVWYQRLGGYVYISLGQNGQVQYTKTMRDVLPVSYLPCDSKDDLCEACYLFGTVHHDSKLAISSKVRVGDARAVNATSEDCYWKTSTVTLPELASPRFTNAYFYLQAYDKSCKELAIKEKWNVDTLISGKEEFKYFENGQILIRGRKEYWHHKPSFVTQNQNKMNVTVRPIKEGVKYQFKVYFDGITKEQLEHLQMAISLGNDKNFAHKLGMGKPLGFGSAKIRVQKIMLRKVFVDVHKNTIVRKMEEFKSQCIGLKSAFGKILTIQQMQEVESMYNFNYLTSLFKITKESEDNLPKVDYPRNASVPACGIKDKDAIENAKIFNWFADNKDRKLPKANSEQLVLEGKVKQKSNFNKNKKY